MKRYHLIIVVLSILLIGSFLVSCNKTLKDTRDEDRESTSLAEATVEPGKTYKVLHIMSYHEGWEWTEMQLAGFKEALAEYDVEYKVLAMDAKTNSSKEWLTEKGEEAKEIIETWKPDLVYASDDEAQEYVTKNYLNSDIPFVFSAVNKAPEYYGFDQADNVTGSLEIEDFKGTIDLLLTIDPDIKSVVVVCDTSEIWQQMLPRLEENVKQFPELDFIILDQIATFKEYQQTVLEYQDKADAMLQIGIFNFKDENNENVVYTDVLKWTIENSNLPDVSYWIDRIANGTLCSVTISGYQHGLAAGNLAKRIMIDGIAPKKLPMELNVKGEPAINIKRAEKLGLEIPAKTLLSLKGYNSYLWEE